MAQGGPSELGCVHTYSQKIGLENGIGPFRGGCAVRSCLILHQNRPGVEVSFALFPEGGDVGVWMGFVVY